MNPEKMLTSLLGRHISLINRHIEIEGENFSFTGTMVNEKTHEMFNFDFHSSQYGMELLLVTKAVL